ncbi:unnamed protein product [Prunus armeniaca]
MPQATVPTRRQRLGVQSDIASPENFQIESQDSYLRKWPESRSQNRPNPNSKFKLPTLKINAILPNHQLDHAEGMNFRRTKPAKFRAKTEDGGPVILVPAPSSLVAGREQGRPKRGRLLQPSRTRGERELAGEREGPARYTEGPGDLLFDHEAEDDLALGISDDDYDGILGMIEGKTLASGGHEFNKEAGRGNQRKPKEVSMNMVLVLLAEPKTKEELLAVAFNEVIPKDEPNKYRHLKPLYISAHVKGVPVSKVFVDCGATVNILPYSLMKKLDKSKEDLIPSDVVMSSFVDDKSKTIGVLPLKITVADQTRVAAFYVVKSSMDYNILLGHDWIHQSGCIPSSLFQLLFFWDGQRVSIHPA